MEEDKLGVLNRIFGNDLTESVITRTLQENNDDFDASVEKLLTTPNNKPRQQPENAPLDPNQQENIHRLHNMFADLSASVIATVYETNKRDVDETVDTLLNIVNKDDSQVRREAEIMRQEQELRVYEEYKRTQQRLQEAERKAAEDSQRRAVEEAQRRAADEAQKRAAEEVQRKAAEAAQKKAAEAAMLKAKEEERRVLEQQQTLAEQEKLLQEFQRKKAEEDRKKVLERAEAEKRAALERTQREADEKKKAEAAEMDRKIQEQLEYAKKIVETEKRRIEDEKRRVEEEKKRVQEKEQALAAEKRKQVQEEAKVRDEEAERRRQEERKLEEDKIMKKRFEEEKAMLQEQRNRAEVERKMLEERLKQERLREEEERRRRYEEEKRFREEQEQARRELEQKMKQLEREREEEEKKRREVKKAEEELKRAEEERAKQEADMRRALELERLKLDEQRKKVEEEKLIAEELRRQVELAALKRAEEEERRRVEEEQRRKEEEERAAEERRRAEDEKMMEEIKKKVAEDQFAASAVLVAPVPKVEIDAAVEGSEIRGQWVLVEGALPSTQAWVGVFPRRSTNTYVGFSYVTGTSGDFHFKGLTPGHYEVRFFTNKPVASRIAESKPLLVGPKVASFSTQQQGDQLIVEYALEAPATPSTWDWVGIFERDQRRNKTYITSVYGNPSGVITAPLPRTPGNYQVRLFAAGSKYNEQACADFVVVDNDCVNAPETAVPDQPLKASWVLRTVEPSSSDWIGLFAVGEANNSKYLSSAYANGTSHGEVSIPVPKTVAPGVYELRLFSSKVGKYTTFKTSGPIHIASP